jgi:TolB-like protein
MEANRPFAALLPMSADHTPTPVDLAHTAAFSLGPLEVRPPTRELIAPAARELLQPRIMQVLVALARRGGEVVSRDDLIRSCWEGRIVGDDAINRCIAKLRDLGQAYEAFAIETIPRVGYRLSAKAEIAAAEPVSEPAAPTAPNAPSRRDEPVLVVLPFENLSADAEMGYFSDGVADEIILTLMRNSQIKVIGRTSAFQFRGERKSQAAQLLAASHALDGAVRRGAKRLRISVQLTESVTSHAIWSESYDHGLADVLDTQEEIAAQVAHALQRALTQQSASARDIDPKAYDLYLRARRVWLALNDEDETAAEELLRHAVTIAPDFAKAWAALASVRAMLLPRDRDLIGEPAHLDALNAAERALEIDSECPEALAAMSLLKPAFADYAEKLHLVEKAIEWAPNNPVLHVARSAWLYSVGRIAEAHQALAMPLRLDPLAPGLESLRASILWSLGRADEALAIIELAHARWRHSPMVWYIKWALLGRSERFDEAAALLGPKQAPRRGVGAEDVAIMSQCLAILRTPRAKRRAACAARLHALANSDAALPLHDCELAAGLGLADEAFDLIDAALDSGRPLAADAHAGFGMARAQSSLQLFTGSPKSGLRNHPRFPRLCARLGLAEYWRASGAWPDFVTGSPRRAELEAELRRADP